MNSWAQVDLISVQSHTNGEKKQIFTYQDHQTKFPQAQPVTYKHTPEFGYQLLDIFSIKGDPLYKLIRENRFLTQWSESFAQSGNLQEQWTENQITGRVKHLYRKSK